MLLVFMYLVIPIVVIFLCQKIPFLDKIGTVLLTFTAGISLAFVFSQLNIGGSPHFKSIQISVVEISVALALPLLVFSVDLIKSFAASKRLFRALVAAIFSVSFMGVLGALLFRNSVENSWQVSGMAVGAYTGGGPNMAAVKSAVAANESLFVNMITYDILFSSIYLVFILFLGARLFALFLKPYVSLYYKGQPDDSGGQPSNPEVQPSDSEMNHLTDEGAASYASLANKDTLLQSLMVISLSAAVVGLSVLLAEFFPKIIQSSITIILITSFGIGISFIKKVRAIKNSFHLGMYLVLVFCLCSGSMIDLNIISNLDADLAYLISFVLFGSLVLHMCICKLLGIDRDSFLISSAATIMSVPFIAVVAGSIKNREILVPGLAIAIIGYVIGSYIGILTANIARLLLEF